jgi:hypothetical protein
LKWSIDWLNFSILKRLVGLMVDVL